MRIHILKCRGDNATSNENKKPTTKMTTTTERKIKYFLFVLNYIVSNNGFEVG